MTNSANSRADRATKVRDALLSNPRIKDLLADYLAAELTKAQEQCAKVNDVIEVRRHQGEVRILGRVLKDLAADAKTAPSA